MKLWLPCHRVQCSADPGLQNTISHHGLLIHESDAPATVDGIVVVCRQVTEPQRMDCPHDWEADTNGREPWTERPTSWGLSTEGRSADLNSMTPLNSEGRFQLGDFSLRLHCPLEVTMCQWGLGAAVPLLLVNISQDREGDARVSVQSPQQMTVV